MKNLYTEDYMKPEEVTMEKIVSLAKRRGFVFPGSEIYGGLAGTYDYGPLGTVLKENIKALWRRAMTFDHENIVELDSAIFMHPKVWEASGHVGGFSDPLVEHKKTNQRFRVDHLLEDIGIVADEKMTTEEIQKLFDDNFEKLKLPKGERSDFSAVQKFNLLVKSNFGTTKEDVSENPVYLRGETAQGIFVNFKNVLDSTILKIPFGIAQIGKAFRNEIKPQQFVFRLREFEQMEMQYFVHPDEAEGIFEEFKKERMSYYVNKLSIPVEKLRFKQHENLVFYAKDAWDIEYNFDFGWKEIEGLHWRGNYDLSQHQEFSGVKLEYTDPYTAEKYIPNVIEASSGLDRVMFMLLANTYKEEIMGDDTRILLSLPASVAPVKLAVSPLLKNKPELVEKAREVFMALKREFGHVMYDDNGNIGKRYRRQDEIGTPFCIVIDFETLGEEKPELKDTVTIRDRDTGNQERIAIQDLQKYLKEKLA